MQDRTLDSTAIQLLLNDAERGDRAALDELFGRAYSELRALARTIRHDNDNETLNTTALVHEAYFKLAPRGGIRAESELHFRRIVGRAMRQVLIDAARVRSAQKRGGGEAVRVTLDAQTPDTQNNAVNFLQLEAALSELEGVDARCASVVECRFFAGMNVEETARALDISAPTVKRDWRAARAWLAKSMAG